MCVPEPHTYRNTLLSDTKIQKYKNRFGLPLVDPGEVIKSDGWGTYNVTGSIKSYDHNCRIPSKGGGGLSN